MSQKASHKIRQYEEDRPKNFVQLWLSQDVAQSSERLSRNLASNYNFQENQTECKNQSRNPLTISKQGTIDYDKNKVLVHQNYSWENNRGFINANLDNLKTISEFASNYKHEQNGVIPADIEKLRVQTFDLQVFQKTLQLYQKQTKNPIPALTSSIRQLLLLSESEHINLFIDIPSILKVSLLEIKNIDRNNEAATISLRIELKISIPGFKSKFSKGFFKEIFSRLRLIFRNNHIEEKTVLVFREANEGTNLGKMWESTPNFYKSVYGWDSEHYEDVREYLTEIQEFQGIILSGQIPEIKARIKGLDLYAPFQIADILGTIQAEPIRTTIKDWQSLLPQINQLNINPAIILRLNLLTINSEQSEKYYFNQIDAKENIKVDGYDLAERFVTIEMTESPTPLKKLVHNLCSSFWSKSMIQSNTKVYRSDNFAHYHFPAYKRPMKSLAVIFGPTIILGIVTLIIFFQDPNSLEGRVANISTVLISLVAMVPIAQEEIKKQHFSFTGILVYLVLITPLLCLFESIYINVLDKPSDPFSSFVFYICLIITLLNLVYLIFMIIMFKFRLEPRYNAKQIWTYKKIQKPLMPGDRSIIPYLKRNQIKVSQTEKSYFLANFPKKSLKALVRETLIKIKDQFNEINEQICEQAARQVYKSVEQKNTVIQKFLNERYGIKIENMFGFMLQKQKFEKQSELTLKYESLDSQSKKENEQTQQQYKIQYNPEDMHSDSDDSSRSQN